ncbi:MAG: SMC family ATPase [Pirellulaceae bacterium]
MPGTDTERGFAQWVNDHVALSYETFTTSVLLLQGRAESLLLATPTERRRLLSHVVGLDRIEQLAKRARNRLAEAEGAAKMCQRQTRELVPVDTSQLQQLRRRLAAAAQKAARHADEVDRLAETLAQATRHHQLTADIEQLRVEIDRLEKDLKIRQREEADELDRAELAARRKALKHLLDSHEQVDQCQANIARLEAQQRTAQENREQQEAVARDAERSLTMIRRELADLMDRERELSEKHTEWSWSCATARRCADSRDNLQRNQSARERLESRLQEAHQQLAAIPDTRPMNEQVVAARNAACKAAEDVVRHETLVSQTHSRLERFQSVSNEQYCPYCLQPLDHSRYEHEHRKLVDEVRRNEVRLERARARRVQAAERESELREESTRQQQLHANLNRRIQEMSAELQGLRLLERELTEQYHRAWKELPPRVRPDPLGNDPDASAATTFPRAAELNRMQQETERLARELNQVVEKRRDLRNSLAEHEAEQQQLAGRRRTCEQALETCREQLAREKGELAGYVTLHASARSAVPVQWRELDPHALEEVIASIPVQSGPDSRSSTDDGGCRTSASDAEAAAREQRSLQAKRDILIEERARLSVTGAPEPEAIEDELRVARHALRQAEEQRAARQSELLAAEQRNEAHRSSKERRHAAERECRLWKRIIKLLGADGLQQALLRTAERAIVQYANTILDRISGGQLFIESSQADRGRSRPAKVLDLVAHVPGTHAHTQDVAFLSGSQKFRVAVALSLAIGQFASNTRRPVQAVIIDEGFGCLDSMNRHVMIQELQNLRDHLQRILLVSHQDEFANAFPDGYRCELVDGATRLVPFPS